MMYIIFCMHTCTNHCTLMNNPWTKYWNGLLPNLSLDELHLVQRMLSCAQNILDLSLTVGLNAAWNSESTRLLVDNDMARIMHNNLIKFAFSWQGDTLRGQRIEPSMSTAIQQWQIPHETHVDAHIMSLHQMTFARRTMGHNCWIIG